MNKYTIPLSLLAAATLAACATSTQGPRPFAQPEAYAAPVPNTSLQAGSGKVVVLLDPTGPVDAITWQRMTLQMNNGATQIVDRRGHQVAMGERVYVR